MKHQTFTTVFATFPCGCVRPNSCACCRTPEEEAQYWEEKLEDLEADEDDYQTEDYN